MRPWHSLSLDVPCDVYGTIGLMGDHRIRLGDDDLQLIVSALRARAAMTSGAREHRLRRLAARLDEGGAGNPRWRLDDYGQLHEEDLEEE
jgi:hypothetical protein